MTTVRTIDPSTINDSPEEATILSYFLIENNNVTKTVYFAADKRFSVSPYITRLLYADGITPPHSIKFSFALLKTQSNNSFDSVYQVLTGQKIGSGAYGEVEKISGRIKFNLQKTAYFKSCARVVKKMKYRSILTSVPNEVLNEYYYLNRLPFYGAKPPVLLDHQPLSANNSVVALVMRYFPGQNLKEVLKTNKKNQTHFTVEERLIISIRLTRALEQLHANHILHRDLKVENVMLERTNLRVTPIDFNLSCDTRFPDKQRVGTPMYGPPELFEELEKSDELMQPLSIASDVFTYSWIIALLWDADKSDANEWDEAHEFAKNCKFKNLFKYIKAEELNHSHRKMLDLTIHGFAHPIREKRLALSEGKNVFESVYLDKYLLLFPSQHTDLKFAYQTGRIARNKIKILETKCDTSSAMNLSRYLKSLIKIYADDFKKIADTKEAIHLFNFACGIVSFTNNETKNEVKDDLEKLYKDFQSVRSGLKGLKQKLPALIATVTNPYLLRTLQSMSFRIQLLLSVAPVLSLEELFKHTAQCQKYRDRFKTEIDMCLAAPLKNPDQPSASGSQANTENDNINESRSYIKRMLHLCNNNRGRVLSKIGFYAQPEEKTKQSPEQGLRRQGRNK